MTNLLDWIYGGAILTMFWLNYRSWRQIHEFDKTLAELRQLHANAEAYEWLYKTALKHAQPTTSDKQ